MLVRLFDLIHSGSDQLNLFPIQFGGYSEMEVIW